jgi:hypothetical protein
MRWVNMNLKHFPSYKITAVIAVVLAMLIGAEFYRIRELLAALVVFTVLFATLGMALLIVFLTREVAVRGMTYFERSMVHVRARHIVASAQPHGDAIFRSAR